MSEFALVRSYQWSCRPQLRLAWKGRKQTRQLIPHLKRALGDVSLGVGSRLKLDPRILGRGLWKAGVRVKSHSSLMTIGSHSPALFLETQSPAFLLEQVITQVQEVKSQDLREWPWTSEKVYPG